MKKIKRIKELFLKLPQWGQTIVGLILVVTVIILVGIIWDFISPFTIKWLLNPLGYVILLIFAGGATLFSGFHLAKVTIGVLKNEKRSFWSHKNKIALGIKNAFSIPLYASKLIYF